MVNDFGFVPKFHAPEKFKGLEYCFFAKIKYPFKGSKTCCHGLLKFGFLSTIVFLELIDLIQSGINLLSDQSPPPITLPALPVDIPGRLNLFKNFFYRL